MTILWLDTVDSTNSEIIRRADTLDNMSVISARAQTAGKGQRGNRWLSSAGSNLTFSILLKEDYGQFFLEAASQFLITEAVTLALTDYLSSRQIKASIKWPNDIYVGDRKICGVLIENSIGGRTLKRSVIGIGLNLNQIEFPADIPNPTSMKQQTGKDYDTHEELESFLEYFRNYAVFPASDSVREEMHRKYLERMYRRDEKHRYLNPGTSEEFFCTIKGTTPVGELLAEMPDGSLKSFAFKEISYIV